MRDLAGDGRKQLSCRRKISRSARHWSLLDESFRAGQSPSGVGSGDAFLFPRKDLACAMRVFETPARSVWRMCGGATADQHGYSPTVKGECDE